MMQHASAFSQSRLYALLSTLERLCVVALLFGSTAPAANWYVDKQAVGNSTGKDWANAWAERDEDTPDAFVHNVFVTHSMFVNNLVVECSHGVSAYWQPVKTTPPWGTAVHYDSENDLILDYNTVTGTKAEDATRIAYGGAVYPGGEMMAIRSLWKHNTSATVRFANPRDWDLRLSPSDTAAVDTGTNLSSYFDYDILNNPRGAGKAWDRGAFEYPPSR